MRVGGLVQHHQVWQPWFGGRSLRGASARDEAHRERREDPGYSAGHVCRKLATVGSAGDVR